MAHVAGCPEPSLLCALLQGRLADVDAEVLERHLLTCEACQSVAASVEAQDDFLRAVRQGAVAQLPVTETAKELIGRLQLLLAKHKNPLPEQEDGVAAASTASMSCSPSVGDDPENMPEEEAVCAFAPPLQADELGRLGPYRVLALLGAGGMGVVHRAEDVLLRREVALKTMRPALVRHGAARDRFLREARAAATIEHDHVVPIYQVGEDAGIPYLAMQLLKGESLDARLRRDGKLSVAEALRVGREIAEGLAAAHERGLIHRDVKPANVWLEGDRARVKILDFGLVRAIDDLSETETDGASEPDKPRAAGTTFTQAGTLLGTPAFMAPGQGAGLAIDARCDLFSLGCVLYRAITGQMPFEGADKTKLLEAVQTHDPPPPRQIDESLPARLSDLVMRLLAKDPARRPASAQAVAVELAALEREHTVAGLAQPAAGPTKAPSRGAAFTGRRRWLFAALLAALLLGGGWWGINALQGPPEVERPDAGKIAAELTSPVLLRQMHRFRWDCGTLQSMQFSPDGNSLVASGMGNKPWSRVWDVESGKVIFEELSANIAQFTPDGQDIVGVSLHAIRVFDRHTGKMKREFGAFTGPWYWGFMLSPDAKTVLTVTSDMRFHLWDVEQERELQSWRYWEGRERVAWTADGKLLFLQIGDRPLWQVWDIAAGKESDQFAFLTNRKGWLTFLPGGREVLSGQDTRAGLSTALVDLATGKEVRNWTIPFPADLGADARGGFTGDYRLYLTFHKDGVGLLRDANTGRELERFPAPFWPVRDMAFSADGRFAAAGSQKGDIVIWRLPDAAALAGTK